MKLKSIEEEATDCRAAFMGIPVGVLALHVHHHMLAEPLTEPAESRIRYILVHKPKHEQALRLRLFRTVPAAHITAELAKAGAEWVNAKAELAKADAELVKAKAELAAKAGAEWVKAKAEWVKAKAELAKADAEWAAKHHAALCPDCPWDGETIFPT